MNNSILIRLFFVLSCFFCSLGFTAGAVIGKFVEAAAAERSDTIAMYQNSGGNTVSVAHGINDLGQKTSTNTTRGTVVTQIDKDNYTFSTPTTYGTITGTLQASNIVKDPVTGTASFDLVVTSTSTSTPYSKTIPVTVVSDGTTLTITIPSSKNPGTSTVLTVPYPNSNESTTEVAVKVIATTEDDALILT